MKNILKFKTLPLTVLLAASMSLSSCRKNEQPAFVDAKVIDAGAVAADGCGWIIKVGNTNYSLTNLADEFKQTELNVIIRYQRLPTKFQCGWGNKIDEIKLLEIKKR